MAKKRKQKRESANLGALQPVLKVFLEMVVKNTSFINTARGLDQGVVPAGRAELL